MTQEPLEQKNNPLHGVKLEALLKELLDKYGWEDLALEINLNCFKNNPSIKSSLKFLRKTEWAREKVERFYLYDYKRLPRPGDDQYEIPPRKRVVSTGKQATSKTQISEAEEPANQQFDDNTAEKVTPAKTAGTFNPWEKSKHTDK